jgi:hypothetical protein
MWMAYSMQSWPEATDVDSSVRRVKRELEDLQFDAEHEAVYGLGRIYTVEECDELAKKYERGVKLCEQYLEDNMCIQCLLKQLKSVGLENYTGIIEEFVNDESSRNKKSKVQPANEPGTSNEGMGLCSQGSS